MAPTILGWFGMPRAKDLMGRVLHDAMDSPRIPADCETYETPEEAFKQVEQVEFMEVDYTELVSNPTPIPESIARFLGDRFTFGPAVRECIKPSLHRQR
jgi:hypothetical protein